MSRVHNFGAGPCTLPLPVLEEAAAELRVSTRTVELDWRFARSILRGREIRQAQVQSWRYDPARDTWSSLPDMPHPRHGLGAVALAGRIYLIGGAQSVGGKDTSDLVEIFNP